MMKSVGSNARAVPVEARLRLAATPILGVVFMLLVVPVCAGMVGCHVYRRERLKLEQAGVQAEGTVAGKHFQWRMLVESLHLDIEFETPQGKRVHRTRIPHGSYGVPETGTSVSLWYDRSDPSVVLTEYERRETIEVEPLLVGVAMGLTLACLGVAIWSRREWRTHSYLIAHGEAVNFRVIGPTNRLTLRSEIEYYFAGRTYRRKAEVAAYFQPGERDAGESLSAFVDSKDPRRVCIAPSAWARECLDPGLGIPKGKVALFSLTYIVYLSSFSALGLWDLLDREILAPSWAWMAVAALSSIALILFTCGIAGHGPLRRRIRR